MYVCMYVCMYVGCVCESPGKCCGCSWRKFPSSYPYRDSRSHFRGSFHDYRLLSSNTNSILYVCMYVCMFQLSTIADKVEGGQLSPDELEFEQ